MSTTTRTSDPVVSTTTAAAGGRFAGTLRRTWSLARAELLLLRRNKTLLSIALVMPVSVIGLFSTLEGVGDGGDTAALATASLVGMLLLFVVYYTVLSTAVARREEGVLQRLRTGEAADAEILTALAVPAVAITLVQTLVLAVAGAAVIDLPLPQDPLLTLAGVLLGCVVFTGLALVTAIASRTLESVQVTSLPVIAVAVVGAGAAVPLDLLPDALARVAEYTPLSPVISLVNAGWTGDPSGADVWRAAATATAWAVVVLLVVRARFRWSPRV
ncbi:ABC transporter permease [Kineococcus sp. NPDC059986]|jgi:ABC-2 type transport system permease protein|uniref:ABC transporter permease n=1 Tax=Kineococcus sp. NPDC059986 TaxID=3155538 RepID=UPI00344DAF04